MLKRDTCVTGSEGAILLAEECGAAASPRARAAPWSWPSSSIAGASGAATTSAVEHGWRTLYSFSPAPERHSRSLCSSYSACASSSSLRGTRRTRGAARDAEAERRDEGLVPSSGEGGGARTTKGMRSTRVALVLVSPGQTPIERT